MKKIFFLAATMIAAMSVNAAEPVVKELTDYANYIDFQALSTSVPGFAEATMSSTKSYTLPNGTVLLGALKGDGTTEADCKWNVKPSYNTTYFVADGLVGVDSINVGTQWRAGANCTMALGAFKTTADGKLKVFYQLNGDDSKVTDPAGVRGIGMSVMGGKMSEYRFATGKNLCVASFDLEADSYEAGDVVLTVLKNTINVCGVQIENLAATGLKDLKAHKAAAKFIKDGRMYVRKADGKLINMLGF